MDLKKYFDVMGFINTSRRIFIVSKKPRWQDYRTMAKITGIGIIIIAVIGFIVILLFRVLKLGV